MKKETELPKGKDEGWVLEIKYIDNDDDNGFSIKVWDMDGAKMRRVFSFMLICFDLWGRKEKGRLRINKRIDRSKKKGRRSVKG
jgi:hypothetical protein